METGGASTGMRDGVLIAARDLSAGYENVRERTRLIALRDIDLDIHEGESVAIVGPSGCASSHASARWRG